LYYVKLTRLLPMSSLSSISTWPIFVLIFLLRKDLIEVHLTHFYTGVTPSNRRPLMMIRLTRQKGKAAFQPHLILLLMLLTEQTKRPLKHPWPVCICLSRVQLKYILGRSNPSIILNKRMRSIIHVGGFGKLAKTSLQIIKSPYKKKELILEFELFQNKGKNHLDS
jgi:hypothetical protein